VVYGDEGTAPLPGLDHDYRLGQSSDDPIPLGEVKGESLFGREELRHQEPLLPDLTAEFTMGRWIDHIQT